MNLWNEQSDQSNGLPIHTDGPVNNAPLTLLTQEQNFLPMHHVPPKANIQSPSCSFRSGLTAPLPWAYIHPWSTYQGPIYPSTTDVDRVDPQWMDYTNSSASQNPQANTTGSSLNEKRAPTVCEDQCIEDPRSQGHRQATRTE